MRRSADRRFADRSGLANDSLSTRVSPIPKSLSARATLNYSSHRSFTAPRAQNGALGQEPPLISAAIIPEHLAATAWERRPPNEDATYSRRAESVFCGAAHSRRAGPIATRRDFPGSAHACARASPLSLSLSLSLFVSVWFSRTRNARGEKRKAARYAHCFLVAATMRRRVRARFVRFRSSSRLIGYRAATLASAGLASVRAARLVGASERERVTFERGSARFARSRRKRRQSLGQSRSARSTETLVAPREC